MRVQISNNLKIWTFSILNRNSKNKKKIQKMLQVKHHIRFLRDYNLYRSIGAITAISTIRKMFSEKKKNRQKKKSIIVKSVHPLLRKQFKNYNTHHNEFQTGN